MQTTVRQPRPVSFTTKPLVFLYTTADWQVLAEEHRANFEEYKREHNGDEPPLHKRSDVYIEWNRHLIEGFVLGVARSRVFECPVYGEDVESKDRWGGPRHKVLPFPPSTRTLQEGAPLQGFETTLQTPPCFLDYDDNGVPYCNPGGNCVAPKGCHVMMTGNSTYCSCYQ